MRKILLFVLFLNVLGFSSSFEEKEIRRFYIEKLEAQRNYLGEMRDSLLQSLQAKDFEATSRYVEVLTDSVYEEYALDKYELMQIYFLMGKLDSAVAALVRDYDSRLEPYAEGAYKHVGVYASTFDDKLNEYLNENASLNTREKLRKQLNRALNADVSQEYKDLADLMNFVFERDTIKNYTRTEEYRKSMRYGFWGEDFVEKDSVYFDSLITKYSAFQNQYPESEFYTWARRENYLERKVKNIKNTTKHYYVERYYTGGIGVEYFHSLSNGSFEWNIVLQYKRFILSANYAQDDDFHYGWNVLLGADVFENKYFKVVPLVGGYDPWMAGMQFEFRPWISEMAHDVPLGSYLSFKAKYVFKYGENERDKKHAKHRFYLGVGFHLW